MHTTQRHSGRCIRTRHVDPTGLQHIGSIHCRGLATAPQAAEAVSERRIYSSRCRISSTTSSLQCSSINCCSRSTRARQRLCRTAAVAGDSAADSPGNSSSGSSSSGLGSTPAAAAAAVADGGGVTPFSKEQLRELTADEESLDQAALADAWREGFEDDLDGLYDYVDRDQLTLREQVDEMYSVPKHLWEQVGLIDKISKFPPGLVADMMGMGTWRLKGMVDEVFEFLVTRIENSFREILDTDLALYPADKWKSKGWDFIDSLDPDRQWDGFSYVDMPDPIKGAEGYPRIMIENRIYSSRVFRKLHLEVARRQDGLQVLHMVLFPRYDFDIPILALDLVAAGGAVTLAIIDACPVTERLQLPQHYAQTMMELQHNFLPDSLVSKEGRAIPAWGSAIFSPLCLCITPKEPEELAGFMKYAVALTRAHLMYSRLLEPLRPTSKPSARRLQELLACHKRFCEQQLANKKTARVLEAAFDQEFSQQYMTQLMFDYSPREDVPWFDGSLAKLYNYFETNPELWADAGLFLKTKLQLDDAKASDYLQRFLSGDPSIKLPRLSFAMQHMYDTDENFQAAVDRSFLDVPPEAIPDTADMGEYLAKQFMDLVYEQQQQQQEGPEAVKEAATSTTAGAAQQQAGAADKDKPS